MKILIVDDQEFKQEQISNVLNSLGATKIDCVVSAAQMFSLLKSEHYDLIVLDNCFKRYPDSAGVERDLGKSLINRFEKSMRDNELIGTTKIICCSSDECDIQTNLPNYLGSVKFDISTDIHSAFKNLIEGH